MAQQTDKRIAIFDIRNIIGALLFLYGLLLTIAGFAPGILGEHKDPAASNNTTDLYVGTDANWWVGLVLLAVGVLFFAWALLRPVVPEDTVPDETVPEDTATQKPAANES
jgi:H+/Cl- antiporter ClcA